jgi:hypothetical protein
MADWHSTVQMEDGSLYSMAIGRKLFPDGTRQPLAILLNLNIIASTLLVDPQYYLVYYPEI